MRVWPRTVALLAATLLNIAPLTAQGTTPLAPTIDSKLQSVAPPAWLQDAVIYEIFPRAFSRQGTLAGITEQLDTLHELGVNVLWLMPISPTGKEKRLGRLGSPYSIMDYYAIDPDLGTKADLTALVQAAHQRKMRVILDMVADHTSWDSVMMAHPNFYQHDSAGKIISPHGWSDVGGLNYDDPELRRYMDDMFLYWLKTFHVDGFRCDAAGMVPTSFWDELRTQIKRENPDALLLAEASKPELMQHAFDLDYAWPLLATFSKVIDEGAPATAIRDTLDTQNALFPHGTQHMLISDDHDEPRAVVRHGERGALAVASLTFTLPGVPLLYNGMEVGDATQSGGSQLFDKVDVDWTNASLFPYVPFFFHALIELRKNSPALQHGAIVWLHNSEEQHVVTFLRRTSEETDLVTVNLSNTPFRGTVEAASGAWKEVSLTSSKPEKSALPALSLDAFQARIFRLIQPN
jgi:cyclomaltodextrinase / maltogenic alpha-amylase / neopullulanase